MIYFIPKYIYHLGNDRWAITSLCFSSIYVLQFIDLGIPKSINKLISQKNIFSSKSETNKYILNGLFVNVFMSIVVGLIIYSFKDIISIYIFSNSRIMDYEKTLLTSSIFSGLILININYLRNIFESNQRFLITSPIRAFTLSIIYFPIIGYQIFNTQIDYLIELLPLFYLSIYLFYLILTIKKYNFYENLNFEKKIILIILKNGNVIFIIGILLMFNNQLDRYFLNYFLGTSNSFFYLTCQDLFSKINNISTSMALSLMPIVSYLSINKIKDVKNILKTISSYLMPILLIFFFLYLLFGAHFLEVWVNESFSQKSFYISKFIISGYLINLLSILIFNSFIGLGKFQNLLFIELTILIFYPLLLYFFIEFFDFEGGAYAIILKEIFRFSCLFILFNKM